ncbi:hypothetical protein Lal_00021619 [Lupinus albus]|nr:hypothetical protein Lal_00021619 [Lupinus albus]
MLRGTTMAVIRQQSLEGSMRGMPRKCLIRHRPEMDSSLEQIDHISLRGIFCIFTFSYFFISHFILSFDDKGNLLWVSALRTFEVDNEQEKGRRLKEWLDKDILRETCSMESLMGVLDIAIACLNKDPSKRPSIMDIVYALCKSEYTGFDISYEGIDSPRVMAR